LTAAFRTGSIDRQNDVTDFLAALHGENAIAILAADPLALTLAVMILLSAALLAAYVPARKASRIDPMTAVRHE